MSGLRKWTIEVSHNRSYRQSHSTDMFGYFFEKAWREKTGHPRGTRIIATKKPMSRRR